MPFADPPFLAFCISAAVYLIIFAAMIGNGGLRENAHGYTARVLLALVIVSFGWAALHGLLRIQALDSPQSLDGYALARAAFYLQLLQAVFFFLFTRSFQRQGAAAQVSRGWAARGLAWALGAAWLAAVVLLYENPLRLPDVLFRTGNMVSYRWLAAFGLGVTGWGACMGAAALLALHDRRRTASPLYRNRMRFWTLALLLGVSGGGLAFAGMALPGGLLHLLAVIIATYTLYTYHLPDLRNALRGATSTLIMGMLTVAVYTGVLLAAPVILTTPLLRSIPPSQRTLAALVLAAALAALANPLLGIVRRFVRDRITSTHYDSHRFISDYAQRISNVVDMEVLAAAAIGAISEALEITHGALVTVSPSEAPAVEGADAAPAEGELLLHPVSDAGDPLPAGRLPAGSPLAQALAREHTPLAQYDIDLLPRFRAMTAGERAWLAALNMDVYVPIYVKERWVGLLALGRKVSGDRYFADDLRILQTLGDQTAVAFENARLVADLKTRNAENERLNRELVQVNAELARLDRAKSDFISIASHELRTPLAQVMGYNDILGEMIASNPEALPSAGEISEAVRKAAVRLEEIVETMFDVSRLETRTLTLACASIAPHVFVSAALENWQAALQQRRITAVVRSLQNLPLLSADGKRMTQVFSYLIQNAIQATPDGGQISIAGRVVVAAEAAAEEAGDAASGAAAAGAVAAGADGASPSGGIPARQYVELVVADTGIGIDATDLEHIFDKFYRAGDVMLHSTGQTKFKGAGPGLGLTIARGIVEAHSGRIWAESSGRDEAACPGARFFVLLPVPA